MLCLLDASGPSISVLDCSNLEGEKEERVVVRGERRFQLGSFNSLLDGPDRLLRGHVEMAT